jgi:glycosyltransferase involved in cell wall biosynthesis
MEKELAIPRVMDLRGTYKGGGGPDKTILNSAAQHDPSRVYVLVTYLRQPDDDEFQIPQMASRLGINYVDVVDRSTFDLACLRRLGELLKEYRLDLVHAHDDKTLLYAWLLKLTRPGLRILYTCHSHAMHGPGDFDTRREYLSFRLRQLSQIFLIKRFLKPIIAVSGDTKQRLVQNGLQESEVEVLLNGIDLGAWSPERGRPVLRAELGCGSEDHLVGTVARITYEKDLPTFFSVAEIVSSRCPGTRFVVVGDGYGDELERARRQVKERGLEQVVHFTGHRSELPDIYRSFDVFLMTSITEGMPNTLLEAMALGVPAVSTEVGGVPELLQDGIGGLLCPAGDAEALALAVLRMLQDARFRKECGARARAQVEERFSFTHRVRRMEEYYLKFSAPTKA